MASRRSKARAVSKRLTGQRNTLKGDPSRTATLRRAFAQELVKRFARIKGALVKLVADDDAFGLERRSVMANSNPNHDKQGRFSSEEDAEEEVDLSEKLEDLMGLNHQDIKEINRLKKTTVLESLTDKQASVKVMQLKNIKGLERVEDVDPVHDAGDVPLVIVGYDDELIDGHHRLSGMLDAGLKKARVIVASKEDLKACDELGGLQGRGSWSEEFWIKWMQARAELPTHNVHHRTHHEIKVDLIAVCKRLAKHPLAMPGYGALDMTNDGSGRLWWTGGDSDGAGFEHVVRRELMKVPGITEVTYRVEIPPEREAANKGGAAPVWDEVWVNDGRDYRHGDPIGQEAIDDAGQERQIVGNYAAIIINGQVGWLPWSEVMERGLAPLVTNDPTPSTAVNLPKRWAGEQDAKKVEAFQRWLRAQYEEQLIGTDAEDLWEAYARAGFMKGAGRAFDDMRKGDQAIKSGEQRLDFWAGTREEFLRSMFAHPVAKEKVQLLAGRSFDDMEGVTDDMSLKLSRLLSDGLVQGQSPRVLAKALSSQLDMSRDRALTVARTEIIRCHAEGQLVALEKTGVEEVGVAVEWLTAEDEKVCPQCESLEGVVLKIDEAHGLLPRHPNCRCCFIPANVGERDEDQKASKPAIDDAFEGADLDATKVGRDRPSNIFNEFLQDGWVFDELDRVLNATAKEE